MLQSRLFWRLFGSYILISALAALGIYQVMAHYHQAEAVAQIERRLSEMTALLEPSASDVLASRLEVAEFQTRAEALTAASQARITLVDISGQVLVDTQENPATIENHLQRAELQQALRQGTGSSERTSATVGIPMKYYARRVDGPSEPAGFIRMSLSLANVNEYVDRQTAPLIGVVLGVSLAGLVASYWMVNRILRPVAELQVAATAIAEGNAAAVPSFERKDELGRLADAFRRMSKQLDKRLRQLQQRAGELSAVLGGMAEGIIAINPQGHVLFANDAATRQFHLPAEIRQRPLWELVRHPAVQKAVDEAAAGHKPHRVEFETLDGNPRQIELNVISMPGEPSQGFVLGFHDVTELRRLERLRSEFVANVSHELKTPLASILACAETLREGAINDADNAMGFVQSIERQGERLQQLILDLLSLARIEAGEEPFEVGPQFARDAAEECVWHHAPKAEVKAVQITVESIDPQLAVLADPEGLRQILDNLMDNAIKYSRPGGQVTLRWTRPNGSPQATLEVSDAGIGIAPADQKRIFERFYRADKARSRDMGGTGLGLSIVKHLAQAFGGSVSVRSELGEGSTFIVVLPAASLSGVNQELSA